jgi:hypothetical protein
MTSTSMQSMEALSVVVKALTSLSADERARVLRAAMAMLGESSASASEALLEEPVGNLSGLSQRARVWMKQNSVTAEQLQQVFHLSEAGAETIAGIPGKSKKEQTYNVYILTGLGQLLITGNASFDDKAARDQCEKSGCYDAANHSVHLRNRGNEFTGSKEKGWTLTAPGLKRAAALVKEMYSE